MRTKKRGKRSHQGGGGHTDGGLSREHPSRPDPRGREDRHLLLRGASSSYVKHIKVLNFTVGCWIYSAILQTGVTWISEPIRLN